MVSLMLMTKHIIHNNVPMNNNIFIIFHYFRLINATINMISNTKTHIATLPYIGNNTSHHDHLMTPHNLTL